VRNLPDSQPVVGVRGRKRHCFLDKRLEDAVDVRATSPGERIRRATIILSADCGRTVANNAGPTDERKMEKLRACQEAEVFESSTERPDVCSQVIARTE